MALLNIPHCGQKFTLTSDCKVDVDYNYLDTAKKLGKALGLVEERGYDLYERKTNRRIDFDDPLVATVIPAGTVLEITKLYIRNKGWFDDCVSFRVVELPGHEIKSCRFTVALAEANKLDGTLEQMKR